MQAIRDFFLPLFTIEKIIALLGLYYVVRSFRNTYKVARNNFIYQLTQAHRDIWSKISQAGLHNITDPFANPNQITSVEFRHINFVILNMKSSFEAHRTKVCKIDHDELLDIGDFLNLPLPNFVWSKNKRYHNKDFVFFIEKAKYLSDPKGNPSPKRTSLRITVIINRIVLFLKKRTVLYKKQFNAFIENRRLKRNIRIFKKNEHIY